MVLEGPVQGQLTPLLWTCGVMWWWVGQSGQLTPPARNQAKRGKPGKMGPARPNSYQRHISEVVW